MNSNKLSSLNALLALDAATCAVMGVALLAASGPIAEVTLVPAGLLFWAGAILIPIAAFMAISARARPVPGWATAVIVIGNMGWAAVSILLPVTGMISPNPLGWTFVLGQAAVVAILAKLEFDALRQQFATA